ncbi:hypothetical protein [Streptomyces chryseus]
MSAAPVTREQAFANARAVLDEALDRIARDRASGRLSPDAELSIRRAERRRADRTQPRAHRTAA